MICQVYNPCPSCGSMYRKGDRCNMCDALAPEPIEDNNRHFNREGHQSQGKIWDAKLHRYIFQKELI